MNQEEANRKLPTGFWRLIAAAILIGNAILLISLWLGAPSWLIVSAPTLAVGIVGVILAYRQRVASGDEN